MNIGVVHFCEGVNRSKMGVYHLQTSVQILNNLDMVINYPVSQVNFPGGRGEGW